MITPIIREYFRGLRERDELDVIVPDLLTSMGFEVISRPTRGPRQYGADVTAVGTDTDGVRKLFLFSIKRGDLTRQEWAGSDQALRQSLDEIKDVVLGERAPEHRDLPVVICITLGGVVPENMQRLVKGYMNSNRTDTLNYQIWSGDTLTSKILDGALREELFSGELRSLLRKAAAMVEEPDVSITYFSTLVEKVAESDEDPVARVRVLYLALWILFVWGRDNGNLDAPYEASELVTLRAWELLWRRIEADDGRRLDASHAFFEIVQLHLQIWEELYGEKVLPRATARHALSFAVGSVNSVDINHAMFETAGRVAMGGLWRLWMEGGSGDAPRVSTKDGGRAKEIAEALGVMPATNPTLLSPFTDDKGIDIALALLLLSAMPSTHWRARDLARGTAQRVMFAFIHHARYPTIDGSYANLLRHPSSQTDEYRRGATSASIIMPLLAMVSWMMGDDEVVQDISEFQRDEMAHCNFQTWVPNSRTEGGIWHGDRWQGSSFGELVVNGDGTELIGKLRAEATANQAYPALSAIRLEHWPVLLMACRRYRLPVPPQLWIHLLEHLRPIPQRNGSEDDTATAAEQGGPATSRPDTTAPVRG
jgi:hypothetical protein